MILPAPLSMSLLAYLFLLLPWGARKSTRLQDAQRATRKAAEASGRTVTAPELTRARVYVNTLINMVLLGVLAFAAAYQMAYAPLSATLDVQRGIVAIAMLLVGSLGLDAAVRRWRFHRDIRELETPELIPRTAAQWATFVVVAVIAALCEEVAYRAVAFESVRVALSSVLEVSPVAYPLAAVFIAIGYALPHQPHGRLAMLTAFVRGILLQAAMWYSGSVVVAIVGHVLLDVITMAVSARSPVRLEASRSAS